MIFIKITYKLSLLFSLLLFAVAVSAQNESGISYLRIHSAYTSFPDSGRAKGHLYKNVLYSAAEHYQDSSVLICYPEHFKAGRKTDMVFWFHGWYNHIDSANKRFELAKQFAASHVNAILVIAETAVDAPDSYGGKLEQPLVFKGLVDDVLTTLKEAHIIKKRSVAGNIVLAGHSGAYRVMAHILAKGGVPVVQTILFDALYGETAKYMDWISSDSSHRFINIYTDGGGTVSETEAMNKQFADKQISSKRIEEPELTPALVATQRILTIHSARQHNDIINQPDNFMLFLQNSPLLRHLK